MEGGESLPYLTLLRQFTKQVLSVPKTRPSPLPYIRFVALMVVDRTMARDVLPLSSGAQSSPGQAIPGGKEGGIMNRFSTWKRKRRPFRTAFSWRIPESNR